VDHDASRIFMEYIEGLTVKEYLLNCNPSDKDAMLLAESVGKVICTMHDSDVIHGDLTTSNMIIRAGGSTGSLPILALIDFGLAYISTVVEDKAVDLYVLERAFLSTHPNSEKMFEAVLRAYRNESNKSSAVISKLTNVRSRGRKKILLG